MRAGPGAGEGGLTVRWLPSVLSRPEEEAAAREEARDREPQQAALAQQGRGRGRRRRAHAAEQPRPEPVAPKPRPEPGSGRRGPHGGGVAEMVACGRGGSGCAVWGGCVSFAFQPNEDGSDDPATLSESAESLFEDGVTADANLATSGFNNDVPQIFTRNKKNWRPPPIGNRVRGAIFCAAPLCGPTPVPRGRHAVRDD